MPFTFKKAVIGGTFDHFHSGHRKLVDTAFEQSEHITIGVAKSNLYKNKFLAETIEDYDTREKFLIEYLKVRGFIDRAKIIPIEDIFGSTLEDRELEVIFATEANLTNISIINTRRLEVNFPELKIVTIPYELDENGEAITSERIRIGEIDRKGFVYKNLFQARILKMPESLRSQLQKPIGKVIKTTHKVLSEFDDQTTVIAVGDIIVAQLKKSKFIPAISIIDFKTRRHEIKNAPDLRGTHAVNEHGTINFTAVEAYQYAVGGFLKDCTPQMILIDGEEDLLALPAILLAPLGSVVLYGQFKKGVVINVVTEDLKTKILNLLKKFE